ncbi:MAG: ATP-binding protein, partial [Prolixibacteraceae bacterium]
VDIPDGLLVIGDRNMLQAVIRNLLSNAIKFTPKGGKISLKATTSVNKMVEISIQDSGIGMSSLLMDGIFSLDRNTSRKGTAGEYGSGFGLIIVKEFIEKQGSELFVESVEGEGTIFRFSLPSEIK